METLDIEPQLIEIVNTMEIIYAKNMNFLKNNHKKLFDKIEKLSQKIENNEIEENFSLDINKENYSIDILDKKTKKFIYGDCDLYTYADKKLEKLDFKKAKKLIFIGTILGTHIGTIIPSIKPKKSLIFEENIEIFRLSLFVTDYEDLNNISKLTFVVGKNLDDSKTSKKFKKFKSKTDVNEIKIIIATDEC